MKKLMIGFAVVLLLAGCQTRFATISVPTDKSQLEDIIVKAKSGDANAQYNLARMYYTSENVTQDLSQAITWFTKAAEQGNASAQYNLGVMYAKGEGVVQDYKQAAMWYTLAAEQGYGIAQSTLGEMYTSGTGVTQDYKQAYVWYSVCAARSGNLEAKDAANAMNEVAKKLTPVVLKKAQTEAKTLIEKVENNLAAKK